MRPCPKKSRPSQIGGKIKRPTHVRSMPPLTCSPHERMVKTGEEDAAELIQKPELDMPGHVAQAGGEADTSDLQPISRSPQGQRHESGSCRRGETRST